MADDFFPPRIILPGRDLLPGMGQQTPRLYQLDASSVVPVALLADFTGYAGNAGLAGDRIGAAGGQRRGFRFTAGSMISVVGFRFIVGGAGVYVMRGDPGVVLLLSLGILWRQGQGSSIVDSVTWGGAPPANTPRLPHDDGTTLDILVQPGQVLTVVSFDQNQPAQFSVTWRELQAGGAGP